VTKRKEAEKRVDKRMAKTRGIRKEGKGGEKAIPKINSWLHP